MEQTKALTGESKGLLVVMIGVLAAAVMIGLTVYPFQYGVVESSLLAGLLVLFALFEVVLDETSF